MSDTLKALEELTKDDAVLIGVQHANGALSLVFARSNDNADWFLLRIEGGYDQIIAMNHVDSRDIIKP